MRLLLILWFTLFFQFVFSQTDCNCREKEIAFSEAYINAHQLIFRGKTIALSKGTDYDKVVFEISQLFKGTASKQVEVYYETKNACSLKFNIGEDWLVYANYKQAKPLMVYCSRSRKNVINTNKNIDLMYVKSDLSLDDEADKLTGLCGLKVFSAPLLENENAHNNIIPNSWERISLIIISLVGFAAIYFLFNKLFKK